MGATVGLVVGDVVGDAVGDTVGPTVGVVVIMLSVVIVLKDSVATWTAAGHQVGWAAVLDISVVVVNYDRSSELKKKYVVTYQHTYVQIDDSGETIPSNQPNRRSVER